MSQNRSTAVMERRAATVQDADDPHTALMRKLEYFPTPPWRPAPAASW